MTAAAEYIVTSGLRRAENAVKPPADATLFASHDVVIGELSGPERFAPNPLNGCTLRAEQWTRGRGAWWVMLMIVDVDGTLLWSTGSRFRSAARAHEEWRTTCVEMEEDR